jgi:anti-sigma regulatory factor (Ser/Thr protein kinase)
LRPSRHDDLRTSTPATAEGIEALCGEFRRRCGVLPRHADRFLAELLLREALNNAVLHGCRSDPAKKVRCRVRLQDAKITIAVSDDGDGFDWRAERNGHAPAARDSGRGLEILRKYATRVRFNSKGNGVTILKRFFGESIEK